MPTSPFDFTSGSVITAAQLNAIGDFDTWTPSWTNITPNSATVEAYYARVNELVFWQLEFIGAADTVYGTSTPFQFSLPSDAPAVTNNAYAPIGNAWLRPNKSSTIYTGLIMTTNGGTALIYAQTANLTYVANAGTRNTIPATWQTTGTFADILASGWYRTN
jgi:hypothetical protein|tara:strand:+ start:828 stop:1313 length:486 start_codon:yes stop_codon:yes gene_type:complete